MDSTDDFTYAPHGFKNGAPAHAKGNFNKVQLFLDTWGFLPNEHSRLDKLNREQLTRLCGYALDAACRIDLAGTNIKIIQKLMHEFGISPDSFPSNVFNK